MHSEISQEECNDQGMSADLVFMASGVSRIGTEPVICRSVSGFLNENSLPPAAGTAKII